VGLPGIGKTSVIDRVKEIAKERNIDIKIVNFGTVMFQIAIVDEKYKYKVKNRDDMRKLSLREQQDLQIRAAKEIKKMAEEGGNIIIDTHACIKMSQQGLCPGLPTRIVRILKNIFMIVYLKRDPKIISKMRKRDKKRDRGDQSIKIKEITDDQEDSEGFAISASNNAGCPFKKIELSKPKNKRDFSPVEIAAEKIIEIFQTS